MQIHMSLPESRVVKARESFRNGSCFWAFPLTLSKNGAKTYSQKIISFTSGIVTNDMMKVTNRYTNFARQNFDMCSDYSFSTFLWFQHPPTYPTSYINTQPDLCTRNRKGVRVRRTLILLQASLLASSVTLARSFNVSFLIYKLV